MIAYIRKMERTMGDGSSGIHAPSARRGVAGAGKESGEESPAGQAHSDGLIAEAGGQATTISRNAVRELRDHPLETAAILAAAAAAIAIAMTPRSNQSREAP
jgi:hypothetical protein